MTRARAEANWRIFNIGAHCIVYFSQAHTQTPGHHHLIMKNAPSCEPFIAELQRAKRASEAPWVRKIGNPSSRENLVMT